MTLSTIPNPRLAIVFPRARPHAAAAFTPDPDIAAQSLLSSFLSNSTNSNKDTADSISASVTIDILPNAEVSILDQNLLSTRSAHTDDVAKEQEIEKQKNNISKLSRALVISGDVGIWTEWISKWNGGKP